MNASKSSLRLDLLRFRRTQTDEEVTRRSEKIIYRLWQHVDWKHISQIHIYTASPVLKEVQTAALIRKIHTMYPMITVSSSTARSDATIPTEKYNLIIVPVVGFDERRHRIGMGGGWYDRFIAGQPQATTVGLAYDWASVAHIADEPHDKTLDCIVTEKRVLLSQNPRSRGRLKE